MSNKDIPTIYTGTIADYSDIIEKYYNNEIDFLTYTQLFNQRAEKLMVEEIKRNKQLQLDEINKRIITNK